MIIFKQIKTKKRHLGKREPTTFGILAYIKLEKRWKWTWWKRKTQMATWRLENRRETDHIRLLLPVRLTYRCSLLFHDSHMLLPSLRNHRLWLKTQRESGQQQADHYTTINSREIHKIHSKTPTSHIWRLHLCWYLNLNSYTVQYHI